MEDHDDALEQDALLSHREALASELDRIAAQDGANPWRAKLRCGLTVPVLAAVTALCGAGFAVAALTDNPPDPISAEYEFGDGEILKTSIKTHCLAEEEWWRERIADNAGLLPTEVVGTDREGVVILGAGEQPPDDICDDAP